MVNKMLTIFQIMMNYWTNWKNIRESESYDGDFEGDSVYEDNRNFIEKIMDFIFSPLIYLVKKYNTEARIALKKRSPTSNCLFIIFTFIFFQCIYEALTVQNVSYFSLTTQAMFSFINIGLSYYFDITLIKFMGLLGIISLIALLGMLATIISLFIALNIGGNIICAQLGNDMTEIISNVLQHILYVTEIRVRTHYFFSILITIAKFIMWITYICILYRYFIVFPTKDIKVYKEHRE